MDEADRVRLRHMRDAGREALRFAEGVSLTALREDRKLALALIKDIEIIGEAASRISRTLQVQQADIPWAVMIAMRNRLIHAYFEIDYDQIWNTVVDDLPGLVAKLEILLGKE